MLKVNIYFVCFILCRGPNSSNSLRAGRSGDRTPVGATFSAPVQTGPGAHQPPLQWVPDPFLGGKAAGAWP